MYETCLQYLERDGWRLEREHTAWLAYKDECRLWGDNPIELLGLASIHARVSPGTAPSSYWWRAETSGERRVSDRLEDEAEARKAELQRWRDKPDWAVRIQRCFAETRGSAEQRVRESRDLLGVGPLTLWPVLVEMELLDEAPPAVLHDRCRMCAGSGRLDVFD